MKCGIGSVVRQVLEPASIAFAFLLLPPPAALACSCIADVPLCQSFWQADAVFSGEVLSFENVDSNQPLSRRVARIRLERAWRGQLQGTIEVTTGAGGGDCGFSFRRGSRYLVYAQRTKNGGLTTNICTPTKLLDKAAADLAYFEEAQKPSSGGRISGLAHHEVKGADLTRAKGVTITLAGGSLTRTAVTNDEGAFEFTSVPAGEYSVSMAGATTPPGKVSLRDPRACAVVNVWAPR